MSSSPAAEPAPYPPTWGETERREAEDDAKPKYERNSRAQMALGIVLTSVGPVVMLGGMVAAVSSRDDGPGIAAAVLGGLGLLVGIPLIVIGAKKVPVDAVARAIPAPELNIGPASATLRFRL
jgi:hypothetical protein